MVLPASGDLNRRVTVNTRTTGINPGLVFVRKQWCKIMPASSKELDAGAAIGSVGEYSITFMAAPVITAKQVWWPRTALNMRWWVW